MYNAWIGRNWKIFGWLMLVDWLHLGRLYIRRWELTISLLHCHLSESGLSSLSEASSVHSSTVQYDGRSNRQRLADRCVAAVRRSHQRRDVPWRVRPARSGRHGGHAVQPLRSGRRPSRRVAASASLAVDACGIPPHGGRVPPAGAAPSARVTDAPHTALDQCRRTRRDLRPRHVRRTRRSHADRQRGLGTARWTISSSGSRGSSQLERREAWLHRRRADGDGALTLEVVPIRSRVRPNASSFRSDRVFGLLVPCHCRLRRLHFWGSRVPHTCCPRRWRRSRDAVGRRRMRRYGYATMPNSTLLPDPATNPGLVLTCRTAVSEMIALAKHVEPTSWRVPLPINTVVYLYSETCNYKEPLEKNDPLQDNTDKYVM